MINAHGRVDQIAKLLQPDWSVVDFGCGDGYLSTLHKKTVNVDIEETTPAIWKIDLNKERPDVYGDCAVMSGLLEWLDKPLDMIDWVFLNGRFKHAYFSYAMKRADPRWVYACTFQEIMTLLTDIRCIILLHPWQGQMLFFTRKV